MQSDRVSAVEGISRRHSEEAFYGARVSRESELRRRLTPSTAWMSKALRSGRGVIG